MPYFALVHRVMELSALLRSLKSPLPMVRPNHSCSLPYPPVQSKNQILSTSRRLWLQSINIALSHIPVLPLRQTLLRISECGGEVGSAVILPAPQPPQTWAPPTQNFVFADGDDGEEHASVIPHSKMDAVKIMSNGHLINVSYLTPSHMLLRSPSLLIAAVARRSRMAVGQKERDGGQR